MKLGVIRRLDQNGRVQVPNDFRSSLGISSTTDLNVYVEDGKIIISPTTSIGITNCCFCGKTIGTTFNANSVCDACLNRIKGTGGIL